MQIQYLEEPVSDYLQAAVSTVLLIHDQVLFHIWFASHFQTMILIDTKKGMQLELSILNVIVLQYSSSFELGQQF